MLSRGLLFRDSCCLAHFEHLCRSIRGEKVHHAGDETSPACLVTGAQAGPVVAMEVLVEEHEIAPMRILLEFSGATVNRPPSLAVSQEDSCEPSAQILRHLIQRHQMS